MPTFSTIRRLTLVAFVAAPYAVMAMEASPPDLAGVIGFEEPAPVAPRPAGSGLKVMVTDDWAMPGATKLAAVTPTEERL